MKYITLKKTLIAAALIGITGCTSQYRTVEEPIEGEARQSLDTYRAYEQEWEIAYRNKGEYFSHLGIARSVSANVKEEQRVMRYSYKGSDPEDCITLSVGTLGLLWAIDTIFWVAQFGTSDGMCWAQIIDTDPYETWSDEYKTGAQAHYYDLKHGYPSVSYQGKQIQGKFVRTGVWQFENNQLPPNFNIDDIQIK
jgi:hypothetical protein